MRVDAEKVVVVGSGSDSAEFAFRQPTAGEWNRFQADLYPLHRNKMTNNSTAARAALFDKLITRVDGLEDAQGPIGIDATERIPDRLKEKTIFQAFEQEEIDVKN